MSDKDCAINPLTNRPIKKGGAIYNRLLKKGLLDNPKTDCVINEKTGRAVRSSGKVGKKIAEKKEAGGKLAGAIKRKLTKKPEPPKKLGFEDLPVDVKDLITDKVYENMTQKELLNYLKERMNKLNMTYPGYTKYNKEQLIKAIKDSFDFEKKNNIKPKTDEDFKDEYKNKKRNEMIREINKIVDELTDGGRIPALNKLANKDLYYLLYEGGIEEKFEKFKNKKPTQKKKLTIFDVVEIPPKSS